MGDWKRIRLFLVGDGGAGKSSVLRWLKGDPFVEQRIPTDGAAIETIDLKDWREITYDHTSVFNLKRFLRITQPMQTDATPGTSKSSIDETTFSNGGARPAEVMSSRDSNEIRNMASAEVVKDFIEKKFKQRTRETVTQGITFHIWDCGGQEVYYNTHHFFFTTMAIYVVVVDLSLDDFETKGIKRVEYWIRTIRSYAPKQVNVHDYKFCS